MDLDIQETSKRDRSGMVIFFNALSVKWQGKFTKYKITHKNKTLKFYIQSHEFNCLF